MYLCGVALKEQLGSADTMPEVSRDDLIRQLTTDSKRLVDEPGSMRELLLKYIVRVDIAPDLITVHAVADLARMSVHAFDLDITSHRLLYRNVYVILFAD